MAWIVLWHYEFFELTIAVMLVLLLSLIVVYRQVRAATPSTPAYHWTTQLAFSIYLGWISVATIANASQLLYYLNWDAFGLSAELWAIIMLVVAAVLGFVMLMRERDVAYVAVLIWAFVGIANKQADAAGIVYAAFGLAALLLVGSLLSLRRPA
jgi:hypothetical protein